MPASATHEPRVRLSDSAMAGSTVPAIAAAIQPSPAPTGMGQPPHTSRVNAKAPQRRTTPAKVW